MRERKTPVRLELHRLKYHQNGRRGPLLDYRDLTKEEKDLIQRDLLQDVRIKRIDFTGDMDEQIFDEIYVQVLSDWGVACPHSLYSIVVDNFVHKCSVCGCPLIISNINDGLKKAKM